jgi:NAD(P)-dependent dehydrogenase (short-subunit alcohol dehydrogenase family)
VTLEGKVILITGAGSPLGLGHAMAVALGGAGARIALVDVDREGLATSAEDVRKAGGSALVIEADVADAAQAETAVQRAIAELGGLHMLINNAGVNLRRTGLAGNNPSPFWEVPPAAWAKMMQVNVNGPFYMARAAVGHLMGQGWGRIIGVTTSLDTMIRAGGTPYGPTKAGHEAFVACMAEELEGTGVTANVLVPGGATYTGFTDPARDRTGLLDAKVMQAPALWLASEDSNGFNGRRIMANLWDESLPLKERVAKASAPAAWPQLGRPAISR